MNADGQSWYEARNQTALEKVLSTHETPPFLFYRLVRERLLISGYPARSPVESNISSLNWTLKAKFPPQSLAPRILDF
jgi:hypothetical protein